MKWTVTKNNSMNSFSLIVYVKKTSTNGWFVNRAILKCMYDCTHLIKIKWE